MPWEARAAVFLKAADLLAGPYRDEINAATMLAQSKTVYQAEIDSACELIDFWRYNVALHGADLPRAATVRARGRWNHDGSSPARGLRVRDHAVQLHRHRRQSSDRSRDAGQRRDLEAGGERRVQRPRDRAHPRRRAGLPPGVINLRAG